MDDYSLSSKELRTLRKMRHRDHVPADEIYNYHDLLIRGFIKMNYTDKFDSFGCQITDGTYSLTEKYWRLSRVQTETWIWRFIPIVISVIALIKSFIS